MNHLLNLTKKELKELLTPGAIVSVVMMVFIFMGVGTMISSETESLSAPSKIGIINDDTGYWSEFAIESMYYYYTDYPEGPMLAYEEALEYIFVLDVPSGDFEGINKEMNDNGLVTVFLIPDDFTERINSKEQTTIRQYYVFNNEGLLGTTSSLVSSLQIPLVSSMISYELTSSITEPGTPAGFLLQPVVVSPPQTYVKGEIHDGVTPTDIASTIMSQTMMVPIVIMMIIMVIGGMVISSMGTEKENKTLETLLTMPMKRTTIVSGKLMAAAIVGLIYGILYMVGMSFYVGGVTGSMGGVNLQDYGLSMGILEWALMAVMIFLAIFCALGICMILGAFTKNFKASQTMLLPIMVLAMIPMFVTMFTTWGSLPPLVQGIIFAIPFSHPMMGMNNLMFGDMTIVLAGIAYLLVFTLAIIFITVRLYKSDILLTGLGATRAGKAAKALAKKGR